VLEVRARNVLGEVSDIRTLVFSIPQPLLLRWYFILFYVLVLVGIVYGIIKYRERSLKETQRILEDKVAQRTADLAKAKDQAEKLLLNILPKETAQELQISGKATARHYNQVSVLFTDFKGFTQFAENTKPQELVNELHRCFVSFDEIIGKYFLEKIKTIGDAYMCAGGVPIRNNSNAIAITLAGLEIRDEMLRIAEEKRLNNEPVLEIRIGIHTGPLTAGVVGLKKFAYDIWGDTVNTASRMETASEPGKVNVSGITYDLIKKYFECEYRGHKEVKGKGLVEMYFVNQIKPEFSIDGLGKEANESLWELIR
jgi:class 3 adenylate cyclase